MTRQVWSFVFFVSPHLRQGCTAAVVAAMFSMQWPWLLVARVPSTIAMKYEPRLGKRELKLTWSTVPWRQSRWTQQPWRLQCTTRAEAPPIVADEDGEERPLSSNGSDKYHEEALFLARPDHGEISSSYDSTAQVHSSSKCSYSRSGTESR